METRPNHPQATHPIVMQEVERSIAAMNVQPAFAHKEWVRRNIELVMRRSERGAFAMYLAGIPDANERSRAKEHRETFAARVRHERAKELENRQWAIPEQLLERIGTYQRRLIDILWEHEGSVVPYEIVIRAYSERRKIGGWEVLSSIMRDFRKHLDDCEVGTVSSIGKRGYLFLSQTATKLPTKLLRDIQSHGRGGRSSELLSMLRDDAPNVVPYDDILAPLEKGEASSSTLATNITTLNAHGQGRNFLVQAENGEGYRILTPSHVPRDWIGAMAELDLRARDADMLIHFLTREGHVVGRDELSCFFPEGTTDNGFNTGMSRFITRVAKAGVTIEKRRNTKAMGRPLLGFVCSHGLTHAPMAAAHAEAALIDSLDPNAHPLLSREEEHAWNEGKFRAREAMRHRVTVLLRNEAVRSLAGDLLDEPEFSDESLRSKEEFNEQMGRRTTRRIKQLRDILVRHANGLDGCGEHVAELGKALDLHATATQQIVASLRGYALHLANARSRRGESSFKNKDDYVSAAFLGLSNGVNRFDHRLGSRAITYVTWWINREMSSETGRIHEGWSVKNFGRVHKDGPRPISLDASRNPGEKKERTLRDAIADEGESDGDALEHAEERTFALHLLDAAKLTPDEREMVDLHYGLRLDAVGEREKAGLTIEEIAERMHISSSRVKAVLSKTMRKIMLAARPYQRERVVDEGE